MNKLNSSWPLQYNMQNQFQFYSAITQRPKVYLSNKKMKKYLNTRLD